MKFFHNLLDNKKMTCYNVTNGFRRYTLRKFILLPLFLFTLTFTVKAYPLTASALSEMLQTEFGRRNAFVMIERRTLSRILEEQSLELSGLIENDATKIGQLAGADKIITGSVMKVDGKFVLLVKLIDVSSGVVDITEGVKVNDESKLERGLRSIVDKIIKRAKEKWGDSLLTMKIAVTELDDLREPESNPVYRQYIVSVTPTVQNMPVSYRANQLLSVDVLSALSKGAFIDYEFVFNKVGMGFLVNLSFPAQGSMLFAFGMDFKYYPVNIGNVVYPYLGLGYLMTFSPLSTPLMGSAGLRIHPIPGFDKLFIDAGGGVLMNLYPLIMPDLFPAGESLFTPYITAKIGWKF